MSFDFKMYYLYKSISKIKHKYDFNMMYSFELDNEMENLEHLQDLLMSKKISSQEFKKMQISNKIDSLLPLIGPMSLYLKKTKNEIYDYLNDKGLADKRIVNFISLYKEKKESQNVIIKRISDIHESSFFKKIKIKKEIEEEIKDDTFIRKNFQLEQIIDYEKSGYIKISKLYNNDSLTFLLNESEYGTLKKIMDEMFKEEKSKFDPHVFLKEVIVSQYESKKYLKSVMKNEDENNESLMNAAMEIAQVCKDFPIEAISKMINLIDKINYSYSSEQIGSRSYYANKNREEVGQRSVEYRKYLKLFFESLYLKKELTNTINTSEIKQEKEIRKKRL